MNKLIKFAFVCFLSSVVLSCEKNDSNENILTPITPGQTTLSVLKSKRFYNSTAGTGVNFDINYVSFMSDGNIFTQFKYEKYTEGNAFTVIWDGELHQHNDSSYYYFAIHNEVAGDPTGVVECDSTLLNTNILLLGITPEQLKAPKIGVKITNTSKPDFVRYIPLFNGYGSWGVISYR